MKKSLLYLRSGKIQCKKSSSTYGLRKLNEKKFLPYLRSGEAK